MRPVLFATCIGAMILIGLVACSTMRTTADGTPSKSGNYTTKKVCGVTYSHKPQESDAEWIQRWLRVGIIGCLFIVAAGAALCVLNAVNKISFDYGDEIVLVGMVMGATLALCHLLVTLWIYIAIGGGVTGSIMYWVYHRRKRARKATGEADA